MALFIAGSVLFFVVGILFLIAPNVLVKLSELGNKMIFTDHSPFAHRKVTAVILFLMSVVMFYVAMTFGK